MWAFPLTSTPAGPATNLLHHQYTGRVPDTKGWCRQERKPLVLSGSCRIHTESSRTTETIISAAVTDTSHPSSLLKHCFSSKQTQLSRSHPRYCPKTLETQSESPLQELGKRCRNSCKQFLPLPPFITPSVVHSKGYIGQLHQEYVSSRCIFTPGAGTSLQKHPSNSDMKAYLQSMTFSSAFFFFSPAAQQIPPDSQHWNLLQIKNKLQWHQSQGRLVWNTNTNGEGKCAFSAAAIQHMFI